MLLLAAQLAASLAVGECDFDSEIDSDQCFATLAIQSGDPSYCAHLEGDFEQADCRSAVAIAAGQVDCTDLDSEMSRSQCHESGQIGFEYARERDAQAQAESEATERAEASLAEQQAVRETTEAQLEEQRAQTAALEEQLAEQQALRAALEESLETGEAPPAEAGPGTPSATP